MTCRECDDLSQRLDNQAATNRALIREIDRLRIELVRLGLHELSETSAMDLRLKATLTGGV